MLGFHFQRPVNDWPVAAQLLPDRSVIKAIDNVQLLAEAKRINPTFHTNLRHWVHQNLPASDADFQAEAKAFFDTFIDGTFRQHAHAVDSVSEWNEYFGNHQSEDERWRWIAWARACAVVWERDFRSQADYRHIRLVLAETAVGNDIPLEVAKIAHQHDCLIGYHPYVPMWQGKIMPHEWQFYSGRWTEMDKRYRAAGYTVDWFFGEAGPVKDASGTAWKGHLAANDGWRERDCCNGDVEAYLKAIRYWCERTAAWNAANNNRAIGGVLFTSGGGSRWKWFETMMPEIEAIARLVRQWPPQQPTTPPVDPPQPPVEPPLPPVEPIPPAQLNHTIHLLPTDTSPDELATVTAYLHPTKSAFTYSADVAHAVMWQDPERGDVVVWDGQRWDGDIFTWFAARGISTVARAFAELEEEQGLVDEPSPPFAVIVDDLPKHKELKYGSRSLETIDTIVVHHSAGSTNIEGIANFHINTRGWPGIAYHFCVQPSGAIYQTNHLTTRSYHAGGHNNHTMGICLLGNFQEEPPTEMALKALSWLVDYLQEGDLSHVKDVEPHRHFVETACPGNTWRDWWPY